MCNWLKNILILNLFSSKDTCVFVLLVQLVNIVKLCMEYVKPVFVVQMDDAWTWPIIHTNVFATMAILVHSVRHLLMLAMQIPARTVLYVRAGEQTIHVTASQV